MVVSGLPSPSVQTESFGAVGTVCRASPCFLDGRKAVDSNRGPGTPNLFKSGCNGTDVCRVGGWGEVLL